jgi:hypothetical protein
VLLGQLRAKTSLDDVYTDCHATSPCEFASGGAQRMELSVGVFQVYFRGVAVGNAFGAMGRRHPGEIRLEAVGGRRFEGNLLKAVGIGIG